MNFNDDNIEEIFDFQSVYNDAYVDLDVEMPRPEPLISIGTNSKGYDINVLTAGEMSAIVAPSKSMKSFFKSALISRYIGGSSDNLFPSIKTHRTDDFGIIDIDTEQGKFYTQKTFRRVHKMNNFVYQNYKGFAMRKYNAEERVNFTDELLKRQIEIFGKPIKLVCIDGIADYVDDTNDIVMSKRISDKLMRWTDEYNLHICVVIHKLGGSNKPVGHLGSFITKKAETVFLLERDEDRKVINVQTPFSRGEQFEPFDFAINNDGLPYEVTNLIIGQDKIITPNKEQDIPF